jgi:hypothetical protein
MVGWKKELSKEGMFIVILFHGWLEEGIVKGRQACLS